MGAGMQELLLACAHHLLVLGLVGLVATEAVLVRPG
jgi:uncharacterized membrane protein